MMGLTPAQAKTFAFLSDRIGQGGVAPSYDEIRDHLGLRSKSGVHRLISGLEAKGVIRRLPFRARAIEIVQQRTYDDGLRDGFEAFLKILGCCASIEDARKCVADLAAGVRKLAGADA